MTYELLLVFPGNPTPILAGRHTGFHVFSSRFFFTFNTSPCMLGSWVTPCSTRSAALHVAVQNLPRRVINPSYPLINEQFDIGNGPSMIYLLKHVELLQCDLCSINFKQPFHEQGGGSMGPGRQSIL